MRRIKGRNTSPELHVRKLLHAAGLRFRLHVKGLPGSPDLVFPARKVATFVHGCFWHQHNCHLSKPPEQRREFWDQKLRLNRRRDAESLSQLHALGWRTVVIWECSLRGRERLLQSDVVEAAVRFIREGAEQTLEISGRCT